MNETLIFILIGVIIGAFLANFYRVWFPWLFSLPQFFAWYSNNVMARPRLAKTKIAKKFYDYIENILEYRGTLKTKNMFDVFRYLIDHDKSPSRGFMREVDAILDRHIAGTCTAEYAMRRINEVEQQFQEYQQKTQGV